MSTDQHSASEQQPAESWAVVEVMGHSRYAGRISQDQSMGFPLLRVDVPAVPGREPFSKLLAPASLFAVTPCTEAVARAAAQEFHSRPLSLLCLPDMTRPLPFGDDADDVLDDEEL